MKRYIRASQGAETITGRTWEQFIKNIESQTSFKVDSADKRSEPHSKYITLYKGEQSYRAEWCRYSDGEYELVLENITEAR